MPPPPRSSCGQRSYGRPVDGSSGGSNCVPYYRLLWTLGGVVEAVLWKWLCGGGCVVEVVVWWRLCCGSGCVVEAVLWKWLCSGGCTVGVVVWWRMYSGSGCVVEDVQWEWLCGGRCIVRGACAVGGWGIVWWVAVVRGCYLDVVVWLLCVVMWWW